MRPKRDGRTGRRRASLSGSTGLPPAALPPRRMRSWRDGIWSDAKRRSRQDAVLDADQEVFDLPRAGFGAHKCDRGVPAQPHLLLMQPLPCLILVLQDMLGEGEESRKPVDAVAGGDGKS